MIICKTCTLLKERIKWSKSSFQNIIFQMGDLVLKGQLVELDEVTPVGPFLTVRYKCVECNAVWRLTHPDQAMKGGIYVE